MRIASACILIIVIAVTAQAQLQLLPDSNTQAIFGGDAHTLELHWHNGATRTSDVNVSARMFQVSMATAAPIGQWPWKKMSALPEQTIVETAALEFPSVRAETPFLIQWMEGNDRVIGTTDVLVYPTNLLKELNPIAANENAFGAFDPSNQLKPLLASLRIPFVNLEETGVGSFRGRLAVIGPFRSVLDMPDSLKESVIALSKRGIGVIWFQPPPKNRSKLLPSFYLVTEHNRTIVVAQSELVRNLSENPRAQLNLIELARLALNPQPFRLPEMPAENTSP